MRVLDGLPSRTLFPPPASTRRLDKYNRRVHVFLYHVFHNDPKREIFFDRTFVLGVGICQKVNLLRSLLDNWYCRPYWKFEQNEEIKKKNLKARKTHIKNVALHKKRKRFWNKKEALNKRVFVKSIDKSCEYLKKKKKSNM